MRSLFKMDSSQVAQRSTRQTTDTAHPGDLNRRESHHIVCHDDWAQLDVDLQRSVFEAMTCWTHPWELKVFRSHINVCHFSWLG